MVAMVAVSTAIRKDSLAALSKALSWNRDSYQRKEKPDQDVMMADSLNEKTIRNRMGMYRKPKPRVRTRARNQRLGLVMSGLPVVLPFVASGCTGRKSKG